jgi:acetyl-CoA carboxylase biotin carboxylase subunit
MIRSIHEMGLSCVAVYSDADADSLHRKMADTAVRLPGRSSQDTYLAIDRLIAAAKESGAEAVHPGYGFLSENATFAQAVTEAGLVFIGPSADAMGAMGDKVRAKQILSQSGVPTVPGSDDAIHDEEELKSVVERLGFPVILKAAAGGGGRGMRVVRSDAELVSSFQACQREAQAYFGNPAVFVERYIDNPRHIEIQILSDGKHAVHLFERDCSIQRRHQKLLEEAPSAYLNADQRRKLGEIAVKAALAVGYQGAGTVEFICEAPDRAYFMEMNTRIQVEHPVTEMITGIDLIAEQINIAQGRGLSLRQEDIPLNGWAIEARINAEDVTQGFMPRPGRIAHVHLPGGPGVRVDTHIYPGYEVPADYDSMIAKLIVWGIDREQALKRLSRALKEMEITGLPTTASFHQALIHDPDFASGEFSTKFLETKLEPLIEQVDSQAATSSTVAALVMAVLGQQSDTRGRLIHDQQRHQWQQTGRLENQRRL